MRRCPYCAEKTITLYEQLGGIIGGGVWEQSELTGMRCPNCRHYCDKMLGVSGNWGYFLLTLAVPWGLLSLLSQYGSLWWIGGAVVGLLLTYMAFHYHFVYYDKRTAQERDADARLTFAVTAEGARVKKWEIYLLRFPKRGTNAYSPVIYAMVCDKRGKKGERVLTLRVIRSDNMDLPDVGEPALLVTPTNKVVEGTITATVPKKEVYFPDAD